jgi:SAM-dependent methyltransferase
VKAWAVTDARWASLRDLALPFWRDWNRRNPLPPSFWQRVWEYPYVASRVPAGSASIDIGGTYPMVLFPSWPNAISVDIRDLNELDHPLHAGLWPKEKLLVADASRIPLDDDAFPYAFSVSSLEEMPDPLAVLEEMLRLARHRVVVTLDVSDSLGLPRERLHELEELLGFQAPDIPADALTSVSPALQELGQSPNPEYRHIRVLGLTLDARETPKSVAILIPHWESWHFLDGCIEAIDRNRTPGIDGRIYVLDDASSDGSFELATAKYGGRADIELMQITRPNRNDADVGFLLDRGLERVAEQYVATIDADLYPLSPDWLAFPIWLLERYGYSTVGVDTGLSNAYASGDSDYLWWQPDDGYLPGAGRYDNDWFTHINNFFRVMPTALAAVVSEQVGFSRAPLEPATTGAPASSLRAKVGRRRTKPEPKPETAAYRPPRGDNGVAASHFVDVNRLGAKFNVPLTSSIGLTPSDGAFGQNVCGLAFHFALSTRALSRERREVADAGSEYQAWVDRIVSNDGIDQSLLQELVAASDRPRAGDDNNGTVPAAWFEAQRAHIDALRERFAAETSP